MNNIPKDLAGLQASASKKYSWRSEVMDGTIPVLDVCETVFYS